MLVCFFLTLTDSSQYYYSSRHATRGADTAEIYISCQWYNDSNYITWNGILHSIDNGEHLSIQRKTNWLVESGFIFGDSVSGGLFQIPFIGQDTFGISFDHGVTFNKKYFNDISGEVAGCMAGEVYIQGWGLYRGINYGDTFTPEPGGDSLPIQEVGTLPGELYAYKQINPSDRPIGLAFSHDYGQTFSVSNLIIPGNPLFDECDLTRGTLPGELYLVVWYDRFHAALYHSFDYGQTITLQSDMPQTLDELLFTAGRTPGTFYYVRREVVETYSWLWIYFSRDYGVTFTTYFHDLNSTYTEISPKGNLPDLRIFPNPAKNKIHIESTKGNENEISVTILTITGDQMIEQRFRNQSQMEMDITNLSAGVYFVKIQTREGTEVKKLVVE